jgi:predicted AAA+ superfamily ATPase
VQRYLDILEGAYIVRTVSPYLTNIAKRVRKTPKLYFRDTGLLHALLGLETTEQVQTWLRMGFSWESFCIEHLIHDAGLVGEECFHHAVQGGAEMELVTNIGGAAYGFDCKHGDVPNVTTSMREVAHDLGIKRVFAVYPGTDSFAMDKSERFIALAWRDITSFRERFL